MERLKVVYLKEEGADALWEEVITSKITDHHDVCVYNVQELADVPFDQFDAVIDMGGSSPTQKLVDALKNAKLWQIVSVGYDLLDMEMLRRAGIPVCHCPGRTSSVGLAEVAVLFILMIVHRYNEAQDVLAHGELYHPMGSEVEGRVLGLIGFGASGQELARLAKPLGVRYMIIEPQEIDRSLLAEYDPEFVGKPDEMDHVFSNADLISLHLPLFPETQGIVDAAKIGLMKPTAWFINMARGDLVDQDALYESLLNNRIGGIGTDVHVGRYPTPDHPVYQHPNFYAMPHVSGTTSGTVRCRAEVCLENLNLLAQGMPLKYRVD